MLYHEKLDWNLIWKLQSKNPWPTKCSPQDEFTNYNMGANFLILVDSELELDLEYN